MKTLFLLLGTFLFVQTAVFAQNRPLQTRNALVIAQQNDVSDRYSLEIALIQMLNAYNVKTKASLNVIKQGGSPLALLSDTLQSKLKEEGIDTYLLVSVRGYNTKFKFPSKQTSFEEEIKAGHLFPLYRDNTTNVTFTFTFYRNLEPIHTELIRVGNVGSKEVVIRKLMKQVEKKLNKSWL
ncbi:MAG: hypothetical protein H3C31_00480 [Brumimicrobium sp.]|nr:hypothetical protein [Brumimicrobium sp.]